MKEGEVMRSDETNEVVIQLENGGIDEELTGTREGRYVRLPRSIAERYSSIKNVIDEWGGTLNNVWGILETETGEPLTNGQKLYVRIRIKLKSGAFVTAAATVALGVVVAVRVVQQSHKKR